MNARRALLLAAIVAAVGAFFAFGGTRWLSLDAVQGANDRVAELYAARPAAVIGAFFAAYVAVTALSLPGAAVMTLLAGAVFGLVVGTVVVSFASSVGALLAMLSARYLLRDAVERRFGRRLADLQRGVARDGAYYLFTLRLVPLFPFFVVNLLMGLTSMRAPTFYVVSQIGMLAGTVVYVNAGTQLAQIESLSGILSPALVASFVLLGVFPLLARKVVDRVQARRVYAPWKARRPKRYDRNVVVIGAGSAGLVTAYIAAAVKARVTLVEAHAMGGDCLNTGCVPSKSLLRTAALLRDVRDAADHGVAVGAPRVDFARVMERVAANVRAIAPHDSVERYRGLGVDVRLGRATIVDPWHVRIEAADGTSDVVSTRAIVVAAGARPALPDLPGLADVGCLTSETLWSLRTLPRRLVVLGGGPIGCELAQAFARLGSAVTLVQRAPRLLPREDADASAIVQRALAADGVAVRVGCEAVRCEGGGESAGADEGTADGDGGAKALVVRDAAGAEHRIAFDELLCAVGRVARLDGYGLEALGIATDGATLAVDAQLRTRIPNVYAAGDVAGPYQFTHAASHQAWYAAVNASFGGFKSFAVDNRVVPWCTFTDPEVARVGLNAADATAAGVDHEATRYDLAELDRAIADGATDGYVEVLTPPGKDTVLGVTIVGAHAGDLIAEWVLAMKHGIGLNKILGTIHVYPTRAESAKAVAGAWKRAHAPQSLLRYVERFHAWRRG